MSGLLFGVVSTRATEVRLGGRVRGVSSSSLIREILSLVEVLGLSVLESSSVIKESSDFSGFFRDDFLETFID